MCLLLLQTRSLSRQLSGVMINDTSKTAKIKKIVITLLLQHIAKMSTAAKLLSPFLAERTNGRAYATVLRLSVTYVLF